MRLLLLALVVAACGDDRLRPVDAGPPDGGLADAAPVDGFAGVDARGPDIGAACTLGGTRASCNGGEICADYATAGFPRGYCTRQSMPCPAGSVFSDNYCLKSCTTDADCRRADLYRCQAIGPNHVCAPIAAPVGTQPDGSACFAGGPLPRETFSAPNVALTAARTDSMDEVEGVPAVNPLTGDATSTYISFAGASSFIGMTRIASGDGSLTQGKLPDPVASECADPTIVYTKDGVLHAIFLGYDLDALGNPMNMHVRVAESSDSGATWSAARAIEPPGQCSASGGECDKPWITVGPWNGGESLYATWAVFDMNGAHLVMSRSDDGGQTWTPPATYTTEDAFTGPNLGTPAVAPDGTVYVTWFAYYAAADDGLVEWGDPRNELFATWSTDGGQTFAPRVKINRAGDGLVFEDPVIAVGAGVVHVGYVTGDGTGAFDVVLATSTDGLASWTYRDVNDDAATPCATHAFPALAEDPARAEVHVTWYENRFGPGQVAYAACPDDAARACGSNEGVSDAPFVLSTGRDLSTWHGDYAGLVVAGSQLWATWSDTRTGAPAMIAAQGTLP